VRVSRAESCDLLCLDLDKAERLRRDRMAQAEATALAVTAQALGDPTRLMLAAALREEDELCVCDLAWVVERSQKLVSHHLRQLRAGGLVGSRRDGKMVMYALTDRGRALLDAVTSGAGSLT
jgi:ArsR family transcriptional regulator, lead/cadmium/zinc/bismuth-responsive transcriptional repressor